MQGTIPLLLTSDGGALGREPVVVSAGVPFPPGVLRDAALVMVRAAGRAEVPSHVEPLAIWPKDGSIRSVLVAFRAPLPPGEYALYEVVYGTPRPPDAAPRPALSANPDGPIAATLPASWYAASEVSGPQVPAIDNGRFPEFESAIERGLSQMTPPYDSYGVGCEGKPTRTYYDGPHALYQRFLRHGDAARYRRARAEAVWYRKNELRAERTLAVHVCQKAYDPGTPLAWGVIRRMVSQGMLDDYLLTGDPEAKAAIAGMGEVLRRNIPALTNGKEDILCVSERNMAWAMLLLTSYYAVNPRPEILAPLRELVDRTIAWQGRGQSGAFEHDVNRVDPEECERGPSGGSPFMTALLVDALMEYHALTGDERVRGVVTRVAAWLQERAMTSDRRAFRYLWGCETDPYDDSGTADLNLLIVPVFGAAYALTGDSRWLRAGDAVADIGVKEMRLSDPKHWNQAMRGFGRYLGYRRALLTPAPGPAQAKK